MKRHIHIRSFGLLCYILCLAALVACADDVSTGDKSLPLAIAVDAKIELLTALTRQIEMGPEDTRKKAEERLNTMLKEGAESLGKSTLRLTGSYQEDIYTEWNSLFHFKPAKAITYKFSQEPPKVYNMRNRHAYSNGMSSQETNASHTPFLLSKCWKVDTRIYWAIIVIGGDPHFMLHFPGSSQWWVSKGIIKSKKNSPDIEIGGTTYYYLPG